MDCLSCGTGNRDGRRFCEECGAPLAPACPTCGATDNRPTAKFCGACGTRLAIRTPGSGASGVEAATPAPPEPVTERRLVSVLFADLVGSTPFAEERDPEEIRDILSRYFELARDAIELYGGTVENFIGDAVMAVWGAPIAREDDAERSVRAALELLDRVSTLGNGIQARVAVLSGEAAVTLGAADQGLVAGDLVNAASRLQSVAPAGAVLVGEATMRAASRAIAFEAIGAQDLKGKRTPLEAWRALRIVAERGGRGRAETLEAPFVGREEELRLLKDALTATGRDRKARLVSITGHAGIGKSRLMWELERYVDGLVQPVYWHRGRSPSYGSGVTFWALGEMLRSRAGLAEGDDEATTRECVGATVARFNTDREEQRWITAAVVSLLGVEPASLPREELFAAWRTLFERIADQGTVVLVFEDLQWAGSGVLDFIDHLIEWGRSAPILVLTLARPELLDRRVDWGSSSRRFIAISLEPLSEPMMRDVLAGLAPALPPEAAEAIVARADGIPLYAVETVRMLLADGGLAVQGVEVRPIDALSTMAVPDTLHALVAARIDALTPSERRLVQDASVLGSSSSTAALAAVAGSDVASLQVRRIGRWPTDRSSA